MERGDKTMGNCSRVKGKGVGQTERQREREKRCEQKRDKELTGYLQMLPSVQGRETILG